MIKYAMFAVVLLCPLAAGAHGGDVDASGCHKESKTGLTHCHRGDSSSESSNRSGKSTDTKRSDFETRCVVRGVEVLAKSRSDCTTAGGTVKN